MKTTELKKFLDKAKKLNAKNKTLPILDNVKLSEGEIFYTNLDVSIKCKIEGLKIKTPVLLPLTGLSKLVDKLPNVDFEISSNDSKIEIATSKGKFSFAVTNVDEYPKSFDCSIDMNTAIYESNIELIKKAANYTAKDDFRPLLKGVFIDKNHIVGTDAHTLAYYRTIDERKESFVLSSTVIPLLENESYKAYKTKDDDTYCLQSETIEIIFRKLKDGNRNEYLNWSAVIPEAKGIKTIFSIDAKQLSETLSCCELQMNQTTKLVQLHVMPTNEVLSVFAEELDYKTSFTNVQSVTAMGDEIKFGLNCKYIQTIMKTEGEKEYTFKITANNRAIIINDNILLLPIL